MPAAFVLVGPAVVEAVRVPVLAAVVCLARVVDEAPVEAVVLPVSEAPVLVGAPVESSVTEAPGVALSLSRPAVMVTGIWRERNGMVPTLAEPETLPADHWATDMLHEAASAAVLSLQLPPSVL